MLSRVAIAVQKGRVEHRVKQVLGGQPDAIVDMRPKSLITDRLAGRLRPDPTESDALASQDWLEAIVAWGSVYLSVGLSPGEPFESVSPTQGQGAPYLEYAVPVPYGERFVQWRLAYPVADGDSLVHPWIRSESELGAVVSAVRLGRLGVSASPDWNPWITPRPAGLTLP